MIKQLMIKQQMIKQRYSNFTAKEVAVALGIDDCSELTGETIAKDMLKGNIKFTKQELRILSAYKGVTVKKLTELDKSFKIYQNLKTEIRKPKLEKLFLTYLQKRI